MVLIIRGGCSAKHLDGEIKEKRNLTQTKCLTQTEVRLKIKKLTRREKENETIYRFTTGG